MNLNRRNFLRGSTLLGAGLGTEMLASRTASAQHEHHQQRSQPEKQKAPPQKAPPQPEAPPKMKQPSSGPAVVPVETPDVPKLPWTMEDGVKVFCLTAEVVKREFLPASPMGSARVVDVWGFNGTMPGPTIEVNEGDRVRVIFHNKLPEGITIHWHGVENPIEMDGMPFISQPIVEPGGMFTYEFTLKQNGTFFYHSHMAMQEMMGLIGLFIMHPKTPHEPRVDKDFGLILQEWAVLPNNSVPNSLAMEFNWLTINGKAGPATTPMIVKLGERVRIRMVNLGMDHHPMHIHGAQFYVTGTEGGRVPETAWFPNNTVLVGVAQARDIEFDAVNPGDWMLHCHLPHHMMNQMVSMVGPMAMAGHGAQTGKGMEEGLGIIRDSNALSSDLAPGLGRGLGPTVERERQLSNLVGQQQPQQSGQPHADHAPASPPQTPQGGHQHGVVMSADEADRRRVPGYPQDMHMIMDEAVAKPETYGLAPGWSGTVVGMMTLVRVLPPDKYEEVMAKVREGRREKPPAQDNRTQPETQHQVMRMETSLMTPNHPLAMAYLQNIATYTRLLRDHVQQCGSINGDFARDVTAEIWRSFDQLDCYRREQMDMTQGGMRMAAMRDHSSISTNAPSEYLALREIGAERGALTPPSPAVQGNQMTDTALRMEACLTQLSAHLIELERETGVADPNPKWVLEHTNAILQILDEMSTTHSGNCSTK